MSRFTKLDIIDYLLTESYASPPSIFPFHSICTELDLISPFDDFHTITDIIQIKQTTPCRITRRRRSSLAESYLQSLSDRVSALELGFDLAKEQKKQKELKAKLDRKYTWTAEINSSDKHGLDRKFKLTTEIKGGKKKESKWTAEIKTKGDDSKKYTWTAEINNSAVDDEEDDEPEKKKEIKKKDKKKEKRPRIVEIQGEPDHDGALVLRHAFDRALVRNKGKKKELSPQDAAMLIQMTFRAYLIKRSQALRALRELAIAKGKLKELRSLFNNFSYRRKLSRDAEEKQKFTEKVIVLLLTVDAIEGADIMVRAAKRSMVDELEAMLDVVDPQPGAGRSVLMKRRTFDMPDGAIQKELAEGVAEVVRMLGQDKPDGSDTFEVCL